MGYVKNILLVVLLGWTTLDVAVIFFGAAVFQTQISQLKLIYFCPYSFLRGCS